MHVQTEPKLFPPKALLWTGPLPYQLKAAAEPPASAELTSLELKRLVSEMID